MATKILIEKCGVTHVTATKERKIMFDAYRSIRRFSVVLSGVLLAAPAACTMAPDDVSDTAEELGDGAIGAADGAPSGAAPHEATTQSSLLGAFDIGVIPATPSCPSNSEAIVIHLDNEDGGANSRSGWIGATVSNSDTTFFFCRVDGQQFRPLTTQFTSTQDHYAVLKLGATCPNNSLDFARHFDDEDSFNASTFSGNIAPNVSDNNTTLRFCLFRSDATTMTGFPNLGFSYGVFATSVFSRRLATGSVHTDDEDAGNANSYSADPGWITDAQRIVSGGVNTTLKLAQVR